MLQKTRAEEKQCNRPMRVLSDQWGVRCTLHHEGDSQICPFVLLRGGDGPPQAQVGQSGWLGLSLPQVLLQSPGRTF